MSDVMNQDPYRIDLMRTLWENTYRGTVFDAKEQYVATIRILLNIPLDRSEVPDNAPIVHPGIIILVEDTVLAPIDVMDFEEILSKIIAKTFTTEDFQPDRIMYFYPSPAESIENQHSEKQDQ